MRVRKINPCQTHIVQCCFQLVEYYWWFFIRWFFHQETCTCNCWSANALDSFIPKIWARILITTSIAHFIKNPRWRTSEHNHICNYLNFQLISIFSDKNWIYSDRDCDFSNVIIGIYKNNEFWKYVEETAKNNSYHFSPIKLIL